MSEEISKYEVFNKYEEAKKLLLIDYDINKDKRYLVAIEALEEMEGKLMSEKNCDTCKYFNGEILISKANAHCLKCMDFDEWESKEEQEDLIHNPKHYTYSNHEPIDVIKAWNLDFDLGNVVKYIARCEHKGNKLSDLHKALEYLQHEIKYLEDK